MEHQRPVHLADLTWPEAREWLARLPIGLLPIGAIEAHGPHLPLDTDVIIATATAARAARRLNERNVSSLLLPSVAYSVSFVGTSFSGTTPVDPDPFESYLASALIHHARQGYRAIVCCNAHLEPAHVARVGAAAKASSGAS